MHHHAQLIFVFLVQAGLHHVGQAVLEPLTSGDPRASASQSAGMIGVSHHARAEIDLELDFSGGLHERWRDILKPAPSLLSSHRSGMLCG